MTEDEFLAVVQKTDPDAHFEDHPVFGRILISKLISPNTCMMLNLGDIHVGGMGSDD